ncbi:MAG: autotransporter domain-containing protein [bacterium]
MNKAPTRFLILPLALGLLSHSLFAQVIPGSVGLVSPFSPGGFNTIGNASVTGYGSLFSANGNPITFEVDAGAAGQKMDVFSIVYPAAQSSQFSVVFSFINTSQGIPTSFFGVQNNFLNGNPTAQFQSGRQEPTSYTVTGAPNITYTLGIGTDVYSLSVRFWLNTQTNITGGNYYPNGLPITTNAPPNSVASGTPGSTNPPTTSVVSGSTGGGTNTVASTPQASSVPINPATGQVYASNINPSKPLNINAYNASGLIDHVANNQLTSNTDFNNVITVLAFLPTAAQTEQALDQILAEPYASIISVTMESINSFRQACMRAAWSGKKIKLPEDERWSVFTDVGNNQANMTGARDGLANFNYNIFQSILGVEYAVTKDFTTGVVMGYGYDHAGGFEYTSANLYANSVNMALLQKYNPGNFRFVGLMGYSDFQYSSTRQINFGSPAAGFINRQASGRWQSDGLVAALNAGYEQKLGPLVFTPSLLFSYVYQLQQGFTETGANSLNLQVNAAQSSSMILAPGFQIEAPIRLSKTLILTPKAFASWEHDFLANQAQNRQVNASFAAVPEPGSLTVFGVNRGADAVNVEAGLELTVNEKWAVYAGAQYQYWGTDQELGYNGGLRYSW